MLGDESEGSIASNSRPGKDAKQKGQFKEHNQSQDVTGICPANSTSDIHL